MERTKGKMGLREEYVPYTYDYFYGFIENATKGREAIFSVSNTKDERNRANAIYLIKCWNAFEPDGLVEKLVELLGRVRVIYPEFSNIQQRALMLKIDEALASAKKARGG